MSENATELHTPPAEPDSSSAPFAGRRAQPGELGGPELDSYGMPVLRSRAVGQDRAGGHQAVHFTFPLTAQNPVQQLLGRDYDRLEARVISTGPPAAAAPSIQNTGSLAAGFAPGATVTSVSLPPGTYTVNWNLNVGGTVTAADANNAELLLNGATVEAVAVTATGSTANFQSQLPITLTIPPGPSLTLAIVAPAAGSGTASIRGQIVAQAAAAGGPAPVVLAQNQAIAEGVAAQIAQGNTFMGPAGSYLPASLDRLLRNCDELWVSWTGAPTLMSVIVSRRLPDVPDARAT